MADQRCGTCRWAGPPPYSSQKWLECSAPAPACFPEEDRAEVRKEDGKDCPCYQPAPQPQTEDCTDAD